MNKEVIIIDIQNDFISKSNFDNSFEKVLISVDSHFDLEKN